MQKAIWCDGFEGVVSGIGVAEDKSAEPSMDSCAVEGANELAYI